MTRTGDDYIASLRDGREVWLDGERVDDVTTHPAFRNAVRSIAHLYDMTHDGRFRDALTYPSPDTGEQVGRSYQIPTSYEDLVARRAAIKLWSEATFGFMGRTPDYKASMWAGFASAPGLFAEGGEQYAANVVNHYRAPARQRPVPVAHDRQSPDQPAGSRVGAGGGLPLCRRRRRARRRLRRARARR